MLSEVKLLMPFYDMVNVPRKGENKNFETQLIGFGNVLELNELKYKICVL